jgi:hypothetical protein
VGFVIKRQANAGVTVLEVTFIMAGAQALHDARTRNSSELAHIMFSTKHLC